MMKSLTHGWISSHVTCIQELVRTRTKSLTFSFTKTVKLAIILSGGVQRYFGIFSVSKWGKKFDSQVDFIIFFKWVGEKPPTHLLIYHIHIYTPPKTNMEGPKILVWKAGNSL